MDRGVEYRRVVPLCFAIGILEGFDIQIIGVTAPALAASFGLRATDLSWLFFLSNLGLMIGAVAGGWLADRHGRRPVLLTAVAIFAWFTLATAMAQSFGWLILLRFLAGTGLGAALPNLVATAADVSPVERRGLITGLMFCGIPLGGAAVAIVSQLDQGRIDWRVLFLIGGSLPLTIGAAVWAWLPETRSARGSAEVRQPPSVLLNEGRWRGTLLLWGANASTLMTLYVVLYWLPTLVIAKGLPSAVGANASAAFNLAGVAGAVLVGLAVDRKGGRRGLPIGYLLFIGAVLLLAPATSAAVVIGLSALAGFLLLGLNYAVYGIAGSIYPPLLRATGAGAAIGAGRVGSLLGPVLPGLLIAAGAGQSGVFWLLVPIAATAAICLTLLSRKHA